jgi:D-glycero-alpha-D-manno-heptose-7-phosphate kinase
MIITRTPFRVTLGGGGTDLPSFYREHGGFILAAALDKHMFLNVNTPIVDDKIRVRYTNAEVVDSVEHVQHALARQAMQHFGISRGLEIVSIADIPAGTGLGSSSSYLVGLLNALHALVQDQVSPQNLAEEACHIELDLMKKPIGKQDQYLAAFGGLTALHIERNGKVNVTRLDLDVELLELLEQNIVLFYTHDIRDATTILQKQDGATRRHDSVVVGSLREIKDIGVEICSAITKGNLRRFGELMDLHWESKKRLSASITNPQIDAWYNLAKENGAIGGKISGAGGGGFLMFYCEEKKPELRKAMRAAGLRELNFRFDFEGSKVIFDAVSRDGRLAHIQRQSHHESERQLVAKLLPLAIPVVQTGGRVPRVLGAANHRGSGRSI